MELCTIVTIILIFIYLIYFYFLVLATLDPCDTQAFSRCRVWGFLSSCSVCTSLAVAQSVSLKCTSFSSCSTQAWLLHIILVPQPGIKPTSPELEDRLFFFFFLEDRFLITGPTGKSQSVFYNCLCIYFYWTSLVAQMVKHLSTMRETWVRSLSQEDSLEKEMETHSSTLA